MKLKRKLYTETGVLSAWSLRPFIPVAFFDEDNFRVERKDLPVLPAEGIAVSDVSILDGQYCLTSESCRRFCSEAAGLFCQKPGFSALFSGVHLFDPAECGPDLSGKLRMRVRHLLEGEAESVLNWKSCTLEVYETEPDLFSSENEWWKRVLFETVFEISFLKAKPR